MSLPVPNTSSDTMERSQGVKLTDLTVSIPSKPPSNPPKARASRWQTLEFRFYLLALVLTVPCMAWSAVQGWIPGSTFVDNSDGQYRSFRNNIPKLTILLVVCTLAKVLYTRVISANRMPFQLVLSLAFVIGLHGTSALKVLTIIMLNYYISRLPSRTGIAATWAFNILVLVLNEQYRGYSFGAISPALAYLDTIYEGAYPRWHISFNITMLRLVSFNLDRIRSTENADRYTAMNLIAYALYPPLYIAGPIISFDDWLSQMTPSVASTSYELVPPKQSDVTSSNDKPTESSKDLQPMAIGRYCFRFLCSFLTMELILHFMFVVAIKDEKVGMGRIKADGSLKGVPYSPMQLSMIGFWNLIIVWLKLLIPWRFFRLWSLLDGINPPENMVRCMANNYSPLSFWRGWHRSYNLWVIKYIYVPLDGNKHVIRNTLVVFTFVAMWHDITFKLLTWGWLITLFVLPEIILTRLASKYNVTTKSWYRHVSALGGVVNVLLMMAANLVGFVIGLDGAQVLFREVFDGWQGFKFLAGVCAALFIGVQLMFEYREEEIRRSIYRRC